MGNYESSRTDEGQSRDVGCHLFLANIHLIYFIIVYLIFIIIIYL